MTTRAAAPSSMQEGSWRGETKAVAACGFCRRRLADEYYFTCRECDASYCYIHMSRHQPALCSRRAERRRGAKGAGALEWRVGGLLVVGAAPPPVSSANV